MKKNIFLLLLVMIVLTGACKKQQRTNRDYTNYEFLGKVYKIPKTENIQIDGEMSDWPNTGMKAFLLAGLNGEVMNVKDLGAECYLGWDEKGLLVCLKVVDDNFVEAKNTDHIFEGDVIELFIANKRGGREMIQYIVNPCITGERTDPLHVTCNMRSSRPLVEQEININTKSRKTDDGYVFEALIPFKSIGKSTQSGEQIAFQVCVNDIDKGIKGKKQLAWHHMPNTYKCSWSMQRLELAREASPRVNYTIRSYVMDEETVHISVIASPVFKGQSVFVYDTTGMIDSATFKTENKVATAKFAIPYIENRRLPYSVWNEDALLGVVDADIVAFRYEEKSGYPLNDEIRIFKMEDHLAMPDKGQILFVGHSFVRYWKTLEADMKGLDVINRGFGGSKIVHLNHYFDKIVLPYKPEKIVVWEGSNDMNDPAVTAEEVFDECVVFVNKVRDYLPGTQQVYFLSNPVIKDFNVKKHEKFKELNKYLVAFAKKDTLTSYIDVTNALINEQGALKQGLLRPDHHHMNEKAYALMAPVVRKHVK